MKLISKTYDYYDNVLKSTKSDQSILFLREQKEFVIKYGRFESVEYKDKENEYVFNLSVVGFCGELYPFVEVQETPLDFTALRFLYYYDINDFFGDYKGIKNAPNSGWHSIVNVKTAIEKWLTKGISRRYWKDDFNVFSEDKLKNIFFEHSIAYYVIRGSKLYKENKVEIYPSLYKIKFFKKFDPYTTYQKIEMFLSNQLIQHDNRKVIIPDKLKAESKGFDKWSFRKMPEDKH